MLVSALAASAAEPYIDGIFGPLGAERLYIIYWTQLAGHTAELQASEDMVTWRTLGQYAGCPTADEGHANLLPEFAVESRFFRTAQTPCAGSVPAVFRMWPDNAFAP